MTAEKLFLILLNRSLAACWLVLAIIILRPFLRRVSRSLCCALWGLVAFRLLCPFSLPSVFSLIPSAEPIATNLVSAQPPAFDGFFSPSEQGFENFAPAPSVINSATASYELTLAQIVTWLWIAGFSFFILHALFSTLRLYVRVRDSVKQEDGYWLCDWVTFPFVLGVFRPRIILPFNVDRRDIPYILAHERAHLARHDHWRKPIAYLLLSAFWFQPVFWIAYYLLRRDVEFACDEHAIRMLGSEKECKAGYAKALLESSSQRFYVAKLSSPLAFGGLQVRSRVRSVLTYKKPAAVRMLAAVLVCVMVAVCFLTDPKVEAGAFVDTSASEGVSKDAVLSVGGSFGEEALSADESSLGGAMASDKSSAEEPIQPSIEPSEEPPMETFIPEESKSEVTWYISEIFQCFVEERNYDPYFIWEWAVNEPERRYRLFGYKTDLIIDIDVDLYLEKRIMVKK